MEWRYSLPHLLFGKAEMFLGSRDLRYAKGRFALIGGVVALITLLVVMLTGLAAGLGRESVAAVSTMPDRGVSQIAFSQPAQGQKVGFDSSRVASSAVKDAADQPGVTEATSLAIAQSRVSVDGVRSAVTVFVVEDGSFAAPSGVRPGSVVVGSGLGKDANVAAGDSITFGDKSVRVQALSDDASYQHVPVVWMTQTDAKAGGVQTAGGTSLALLKTDGSFDAAAFEKQSDLVAMTPNDSLSTISAYQAENGSLTLMRVMLMLVSALVVGAFFTIWTIQRTPDLAVLKAIGARTSYLVRDALGQAAILLLIGGGLGTLIATVGGLLARDVVPFVVSPTTTLVPLVLLMVLGLLGALVSLRRIATVDPNSALGAAR